MSPRLPDHLGGRALCLEALVRRRRLVEVEEAVRLPLDQQGGCLHPAQVRHRRHAAGVGQQLGGPLRRVAPGVERADGLAGLGDEVQAGEGVDAGRVQARLQQRLALADQVEAVRPLPLEGAGHAPVARHVVRGERVGQVVPGDHGDEGVDPVVDGGRRQLDGSPVGAAHHADAWVARRVEGHEVGLRAVVGGPLPAQEVDELCGRQAVDRRVVERDETAGPAEAEPGVDERDVSALGEGLADGVGLAVRLAAAEAVRGEHGGCGVGAVRTGRPVQVGVDRAGAAARLDGELQCGDRVLAGRGGGRSGERERCGERGAEQESERDSGTGHSGTGHTTGHVDLHTEDGRPHRGQPDLPTGKYQSVVMV